MTTREQKIVASVEQYLKERFDESAQQITDDFNAHFDEILAGFQKVLNACVQKAFVQQHQSDKGRLKFVVISLLNSSLITQSYELKIDLFDERMYLDGNEASDYWQPSFMLPYLQIEDMEAVRKLLSGRIPRITDYEMLEVQYGYAGTLCTLYPFFLKKLVHHSKRLISQANPESEVLVLFGNYMEKAPYIAKLQF